MSLDKLDFTTPGNAAISLRVLAEWARIGDVTVSCVVDDAAGIVLSVQERQGARPARIGAQ